MAISGRERVQAALALDVADRPPVSAWGHFYDREWGVEALASATVASEREFAFDFVKLQIRATSFSEAFGARWHYSGSPEAEPVQDVPGGIDAAGWRRIVEGPSSPAVLADQVEVIRLVTAELGPEVPVIQTVFSPGMVAWFLAGRDASHLARLMREQPAVMAAALNKIAEVLAAFSVESLAAGAAGVFYAINPLADTGLVAPTDYASLYLPGDRVAAAGAAGGWFNMLHLCGGNINQALVGELALHSVNWAADDPGNPSLAELRDRFGVAVAGGVGRYSVIQGDDAGELNRIAGRSVEETGGRGHLLTPGCSSSPWSRVRPDLLRALSSAAG